MPNVTFKFVITETPLPADQDGRQQIIASISDDNAKRITDLTGLGAEVEALKAHCHRMLNLARNRFLGYCDHNRSTQAIMEECQRMGMTEPPIAPRGGTGVSGGPTELDRTKARMHDDAHAMLDTLGIAKRSETGAEFTVQHRIGLLNDDAEREKGAAYRDAAEAEADRAKLAARIAELINDINRANERLSVATASIQYWMHEALGRETDGDDRDGELRRLATELEHAKVRADTRDSEVERARQIAEEAQRCMSVASEKGRQAMLERDAIKAAAAEAILALKREWPQQALWRAQSPEAEPIRRLAAAAGVELVEVRDWYR